jgi:membrane dipeptidase
VLLAVALVSSDASGRTVATGASEARSTVNDSHSAPSTGQLVIDTHAHGSHLLPGPFNAIHHLIAPSWPTDVGFGALRASGVDALVATAVGDRLVTRFAWPVSPWRAVLRQLELIRSEAIASGCELVTTRAEIEAAVDRGRTAVILGIEGGDTLAEDLGRVDVIYDLGVRVLGIMHFSDNPFGTICMNFRGADAGEEVAAGRARGLTELGGRLVDELNNRGILIDVAHADPQTIAGICARSTRPVIASHTGARALADFPRYLPDATLTTIAATGGVIGLLLYRGHGMETPDDFARHAVHIADLVGPEHLCIGTDMNGVPALLEGYEGPQSIPLLIDALDRAGFSAADIAGVLGGNVARLL